ncbi:MAG: 2-C-methyl-D-erythritol 2,4-cyclodiphosphate synthase [Treponema sp.]|nr:2-C-methyl-D-erythritol 2,4-cyclodiphosphate synthase [Treponema sp.]
MISLILVAAGSSTRFGTGQKKEYLPMGEGTVLSTSARIFLETLNLDFVCVTYPFSQDFDAEEKSKSENAFFKDSFIKEILGRKNTKIIFEKGGNSRQNSVLNALLRLKSEMELSEKNSQEPSLCLIHDAARPFVKSETILSCVSQAEKTGAAAPGLQPSDTQKETNESGFIARHLVRKNLVAIQTPQVFDFEKILQAHKIAAQKTVEFTDDTEIFDLFAQSSHKTKIVPGDSDNKKITYKSDFKVGSNMNIRTGLGYDKHLLTEGRKLVLGGVEIPFSKGEAGHSDGDVLLHAITDAVLGASGLGDIGSYFPSEDSKWKDADSKQLLSMVWQDVKKAGFSIGNLDCVVLIEKPKFLPYRDEVRKSIANILDCDFSRIFVKAKTGEKTGEVGEGKAVHAFATVLLTAS